MRPRIEDVRSFWDANPCGSRNSGRADRRVYFEEIARVRYALEPHVPEVARFEAHTGRDVLEIGCGIGTDGLRLALGGARYVGVDLSPISITLAREQFALFGAAGRIEVADAEALPFEAESFDHVFSFGVIHHSPDTEAIVREIHRVLRPGGTFTVMIYNRSSINYRLEILVLRRLLRPLLLVPAGPALLSRVLGLDEAKLRHHRELMSRPIEREAWLSMNTDGPDCPLAKVYDRCEALELFAAFEDVETDVRFFNRGHWGPFGRLLPGAVAEALGRRWGWHRIVRGRKAD